MKRNQQKEPKHKEEKNITKTTPRGRGKCREEMILPPIILEEKNSNLHDIKDEIRRRAKDKFTIKFSNKNIIISTNLRRDFLTVKAERYNPTREYVENILKTTHKKDIIC
ncbi:hypothetical protein JTB14_035780 [Gonioctena quinquepunctata]|nr:hypothetical protein JTB14_035780 [Gonioctena quinquepunctata]